MKKKRWVVASVVFICLLMVFAWGFFSYKDVILGGNTFKNGVKINGIDVSGLDKYQAQNIVATTLTDNRNQIDITLEYNNKIWNWKGCDFEVDNQIIPYVENVFNYYNSGNMFKRKYKISKLNNNNEFNISYSQVLTGLKEKISLLAQEIDTPAVDAQVVFDANKNNPLSFSEEQNGIKVDQDKLIQMIDLALNESVKVNLQVPTITVEPNVLKDELQKTVAKRGEFSTSYKNSNNDRKHNVRHALECFNGMVIKPQQEVSFNQTTGSRTEENGYKKANIILNGVYVEGTGGGVCQASTTLYNAILNADLEVLEVNKHTLPASYVWLAFDAMVSEGYADLRFKNNTDNNIYIR
ncbi:MAG: VanW family protein, partial [Clostridia bacterium]|nr:VanW family protein [Clostridia bacterium]